MGRDQAIAALKSRIVARGEMPLADAMAALFSLGFQEEAAINEILSDGLGSEWAARRDATGVVLTPLRSKRAPGLPWADTADDASVCRLCGWDRATEAHEGTRLCEVCLAMLTTGSSR